MQNMTTRQSIELFKTFLFRVLDTFRTFLNELFTGLKGSPGTEGVVFTTIHFFYSKW